MIERGEHFGFALEAGQAFGVAGEFFRQDFDGYVAVEFGVVGLIDVAHAAGADVGGDFTGAEFGAGSEHSIVRGVYSASRRTAKSGCATKTVLSTAPSGPLRASRSGCATKTA